MSTFPFMFFQKLKEKGVIIDGVSYYKTENNTAPPTTINTNAAPPSNEIPPPQQQLDAFGNPVQQPTMPPQAVVETNATPPSPSPQPIVPIQQQQQVVNMPSTFANDSSAPKPV